MDETPCYMDMSSDTTLDFIGNKNVDGVNTGHDKSRFTVVLCFCADGRIINTMMILKGPVNVPRVDVPANIRLYASKGGSMNEKLMHDWIRSVFCSILQRQDKDDSPENNQLSAAIGCHWRAEQEVQTVHASAVGALDASH